ncbi:ADP-ribosylhydrolase ARH3-like isoform X2 [Clavelina lepadiformis]|uniref:ADP-ribosylhydrolase ARH3 n=1 Tax=Clavelina lepadiformis TaxID=159417 RepID=A0ABP0FNM1_CLALP
MLLSKYKGSALAALAGDCIGAEYEAAWQPVAYQTLMELEEILKNSQAASRRFLNYTDDTEMAHELAKSLVENGKFVAKDVASKFTKTFFTSPPCRYYGESVRTVFEKLQKASPFSDPFGPASEQFDGQGSYGNGSAMRVFPVALFCHGNQELLEKLAALSAKLTHVHIDAINGAKLQASAVEIALSSSDGSISWLEFWQKLKDLIDKFEVDVPEKVYTNKLDTIKELIAREEVASVHEFEDEVGTGIKATEAVCAAIYAFLMCLADRQPSELSSLSKVQQVVFYSISLGGDTDTIGTMAGAIAGAFYGDEGLPSYWLSACEGEDMARDLATKLHELNEK